MTARLSAHVVEPGCIVGKTTTLEMLTGMKAATAGTAKIYGLDVNTDMAAIRQRIGVCPQHDVLWLTLTVQEHLSIFARCGSPAPHMPDARARRPFSPPSCQCE